MAAAGGAGDSGVQHVVPDDESGGDAAAGGAGGAVGNGAGAPRSARLSAVEVAEVQLRRGRWEDGEVEVVEMVVVVVVACG